ncbi:uncharacterized protein [Littorina saxatilis]|uniref:uncharacterized protein isoform X1 n=1 Tax=Littorina saxatilis TaxID=31220 RepID=UPI0038B4A915
MFKSVLLLSLAALALGQRHNWWQNIFGTGANVDSVHGFTVQYDDEHDIVIFVNRDACYIVEAQSDRQWDAIIRNTDDLHVFTEAVYNQIQAKTGLSHMSLLLSSPSLSPSPLLQLTASNTIFVCRVTTGGGIQPDPGQDRTEHQVPPTLFPLSLSPLSPSPYCS